MWSPAPVPDTPTIRDMARKLELWRASLSPDDRDEVTSWMRAGVLGDRRRWWFEPSTTRFDEGEPLDER